MRKNISHGGKVLKGNFLIKMLIDVFYDRQQLLRSMLSANGSAVLVDAKVKIFSRITHLIERLDIFCYNYVIMY